MKLPFFKKKKAAAEQPAAPAKPAAARTPFPLAAHQEVEVPAIHIDARVLAFLRKYDAAPDQLDTQALTDALLAAMQRGLRGEPGGLPMLPTYLAPGKHLPDTEGKRVAVVDAAARIFASPPCGMNSVTRSSKTSASCPCPARTERPTGRISSA